MTEQDMLNWIKNASYEELLYKWRFEECGSPWFTGKIGEYFEKIFRAKQRETPASERVVASKHIGWEK